MIWSHQLKGKGWRMHWKQRDSTFFYVQEIHFSCNYKLTSEGWKNNLTNKCSCIKAGKAKLKPGNKGFWCQKGSRRQGGWHRRWLKGLEIRLCMHVVQTSRFSEQLPGATLKHWGRKQSLSTTGCGPKLRERWRDIHYIIIEALKQPDFTRIYMSNERTSRW